MILEAETWREYEEAARDDYRYELMDEARCLQLQSLDEQAEGMGFTSWCAYQEANKSYMSRLRAATSIFRGKIQRGFRLPVNPDNDIPF